MTKQEIRNEMRRRIGAMTADERTSQSAKVAALLTSGQAWRTARTVLLYASLPDEVGTSPLIAQALAEGKRVVLPAVQGDDLKLCYYDEGKIAPSTGPYRLMEPTADAELLTALGDIDLALIPGRAFTANGCRLGRGRGYYDRLLPRLACPTVGLAFSCQLANSLPADPWDIRLSGVVAACLSPKSEKSV